VCRQCREGDRGGAEAAATGGITADGVAHADVENADVIHTEGHVEVIVVADRTGRIADHERGAERSAGVNVDPLERPIRELVRKVRVVRHSLVDAIVTDPKGRRASHTSSGR